MEKNRKIIIIIRITVIYLFIDEKIRISCSIINLIKTLINNKSFEFDGNLQSNLI